MSEIELENKCKELRDLQTLIDEAQQEAEAIKDVIKLAMGDTEEMRAGEYKITWKPVETTRIDTTRLKTICPEIAGLYTKTTITRRFCVV